LLQTLKNEKKKNNGFTNQLASFGNCTLLAAQDEFLLYFFRGWYKAAMVVETDYYFQIMKVDGRIHIFKATKFFVDWISV
jgi:hypothetical protein